VSLGADGLDRGAVPVDTRGVGPLGQHLDEIVDLDARSGRVAVEQPDPFEMMAGLEGRARVEWRPVMELGDGARLTAEELAEQAKEPVSELARLMSELGISPKASSSASAASKRCIRGFWRRCACGRGRPSTKPWPLVWVSSRRRCTSSAPGSSPSMRGPIRRRVQAKAKSRKA